MEQSYPLKSFSVYHSGAADWDGFDSVPSWERPHNGPTLSIPRKPINPSRSAGYESLNEPSNEAYTAYEPTQLRIQRKLGFSSFLSSCLWWLPEIIASLISIISLLAIVIVLRIYDGRDLVQVGLPAGLTLNGIIAAISTVARVALMVPVSSALSQEAWIWFSDNARQPQQTRSRLQDLDLSDNASRGAWGSLLFLILARRRWLAYVGALVTILSLAFGTFTQQLLAIDLFAITDPNSAFAPSHLPRAETWQYWNVNPAEEALTPPLAVRAAIYNGMLSSTIDPIQVYCPTGNCTWPITPSLAICGGCAPSAYTSKCDEYLCNYTMASGSNISLTNTRSTGIGFQVRTNTEGGIYNTSTGDRIYLVNFDTIGAPYKSLTQEFNNTNVKSTECALWLCIQSYSSSMVAGKLNQSVNMSFSNLTVPAFNVTGLWDNYTFADLPKEMNPDSAVTYNVSLIGAEGFRNSLYGLFNGTALVNIESSAASSDGVDAIWNSSSNLDPWIQNVALSMTNAIRYDDPHPHPESNAYVTPAPRRSTYDGTGYQLGVSVRWSWLALPVACVVTSILFLFIVMIKTSRSAVAPWKSSLLTFLFLDFDQEVKERVRGRAHLWRGVTSAVGDTKVVLRQEPEGKWVFKTA